MLRIVLTIVLPLILPTVLYLVWVWLAPATRGARPVRWATLPWLWLAGAGIVLVAALLVFVTVGFGTAQPGTYVPPRWQNGHIVQGHVDPQRSQ